MTIRSVLLPDLLPDAVARDNMRTDGNGRHYPKTQTIQAYSGRIRTIPDGRDTTHGTEIAPGSDVVGKDLQLDRLVHRGVLLLVRTELVIPAKAGSQGYKGLAVALDPRFRGGDAHGWP